MPVLTMELARRGYEEIDPYTFYREIFGDGELDEEGSFTKGKYIGIALEITREKKENGMPLIKRYGIYDNLDTIDMLQHSDNFCVTSPISYAGRKRKSENARKMYALCIEVDNLVVRNGIQSGLNALIEYWEKKHIIPKPTYIVASGSGLHLYYKFLEPISLFPNIAKQLKLLKRELTYKIWNQFVTTSHRKEEVQQESIFQAFRMPGTITKKGERATAHRVGVPITAEYLNQFVKGKNRVDTVYKSTLSRREAQEEHPEWYERRVVQKQPKKQWAMRRTLYEWWFRRISNEAVVGHRYYCMLMLVIYAIKCSVYDPKKNPHPVTQEELERDCLALLDKFDRISPSDNPFTEADMLAALQAWEDKGLYTYPVKSIENRSGIHIEPMKLNGRTQEAHIRWMNLTRAFKISIGECTVGHPAGTSKQRDIIIQWRIAHPDGKKADCARDTGIHRNTVARWWNDSETSIVVPDMPEEMDEYDEYNNEYDPEEAEDYDEHYDDYEYARIREARAIIEAHAKAEIPQPTPEPELIDPDDLPF